MTFYYAWMITARELQASPRWSAATKARTIVCVGIIISAPVVLGTGLPYIYWLVTGRGPWRRYGFSSWVVVNPFPKRPPAEIKAALNDLFQARRAE